MGSFPNTYNDPIKQIRSSLRSTVNVKARGTYLVFFSREKNVKFESRGRGRGKNQNGRNSLTYYVGQSVSGIVEMFYCPLSEGISLYCGGIY